jgi:hypothetical protein
MSRAGAAIARKLRGKTGAPPRAPKRLDRLTDADVTAGIAERREYVKRAAATKARNVPEAERDRSLKVLRETVDDLKRLEAESATRPEPPRVTSSGADARIPVARTAHRLSQMPTARLQAAHEEAQAMQRSREAQWERRRREQAEQAAERKAAVHAQQEERRKARAAQGLAPENPGDWSGWDPDAADTLAAVFSDPSLWLEWAGRDPDKIDRNPPLRAADLLVLHAGLATLAARGTTEVVFSPRSSSDWVPVDFRSSAQGASNAEGCLRHLSANGWLTVRLDGGLLYVGRGRMAEAARAAYVERGRVPQAGGS